MIKKKPEDLKKGDLVVFSEGILTISREPEKLLHGFWKVEIVEDLFPKWTLIQEDDLVEVL